MPTGIEARLLAEAVRIYEQTAGPVPGTAAAEAAARAAGSELEQRILVRARQLDEGIGLTAAIGHVRAALRLVIVAALALAAIAGAGAAQAAMGLGSGPVVNVFVVLVVALGPATAMLLVWLVLAAMRSRRLPGLVGRVGADLSEWLVRLTYRDAAHVAALHATARVMAASGHGRWTFGAVTHGTWLAFLSGLLLVMLFLLSTRSYVFVWETTILSADTYVPLTRWLSAGPALFGFAAPSSEEIRASQWLGSGATLPVAREAWAEFLVGCIVVYGLAPRLALLVLSLVMRSRAARRYRLDTARPGYAQLAPRLMPAAEGLGFADSDAGTEPERARVRRAPAAMRVQPDPRGPVAVLGLELDMPASGWPPPFGQAVLDLGRVQGRQDLRQALDRLRTAAPSPRLLALVCALTTTPDRGLLAYVDAVIAVSDIPLLLLLTGGQRLRSRLTAEAVDSRLDDWHALARKAGIGEDMIVELDLDNLTDRSRARLRALVGGPTEGAAAGTDRLDRAFALIAAEAAGWTGAPDMETQAELHRRIARLYDGEMDWLKRLDPRGLAGDELTARIRSASAAVVAALPARLSLDARWLRAGALAGALGCVAVATLAVPAAIAGLPLWAGLGAVIASAVRATLRDHGKDLLPPSDRADAVRAAALFTLVLEAQGRGEAAITRLIDSALGGEEPVLETDSEIAGWLDGVRRRYRAAEIAEDGSR